jgi:hypothetical protein
MPKNIYFIPAYDSWAVSQPLAGPELTKVNYAPKGNEDGHVAQNLHFQMPFSKGGANAGEASGDGCVRERQTI